MSKKRTGRAAKKTAQRRGGAAEAAPRAPEREPKASRAAPPLLSRTHGGFDALRARLASRADASTGEGEQQKKKKKKEPLSDALKRLEADYERVLKRE